MPNELKFQVKYRVPPNIIYEALTNEELITKYTQTKALFEKSAGGSFNLYDGFITGEVEELMENKKVSMKWKFDNWNELANVTYVIKEKDGNECQITITIKNIPERDVHKQIVDLRTLETGFRTQIFEKIATFLGYPLNMDDEDSDDEN